MNDMNQNTFPSQNFDKTRRLKKVKRPIKRIVPVQGQAPMVSSPSFDTNNGNSQEITNFNIDDILDGTNNLPTQDSDNILKNQDTNDFQPHFINDSDIVPPKVPFMQQIMQGNLFTVKGVTLISICVFVFGIFFAKLFFTQQTVVRDGLQGVVFNPEVPRGRPRCGVAERSQGCVLYLMNPQRQELAAREFYDLASQLTSRQRFVIETGNMRYSNVKIRPGGIAQLNIPPLQ